MRMTVEAARQRFRTARVARLATVGHTSQPHLVPVTFAVIDSEGDGELIVFAIDHKPKSTTALRRLDNIAVNPSVTFLVDAYTEDWDQLWWVRADAVAGPVDGAVRLRAITALRAKYRQYREISPDGGVVGGRVTKWTGWQASQGTDHENP